MFWYNVISHNSSYYFKIYISEKKKKRPQINFGEDLKKRELLYTLGGNVN